MAISSADLLTRLHALKKRCAEAKPEELAARAEELVAAVDGETLLWLIDQTLLAALGTPTPEVLQGRKGTRQTG